jgi:hypothetical protein
MTKLRAPLILLAGAGTAAFGGTLPCWIAGGLVAAVGLLMLIGGE